MPFFPLTTLQEMVLALFFGLGTLFLLYIAWAGYPRRLMEKESADQGNPVPPFLVIVIILVMVWALAYFLFVGLKVKAIG
jgi:hypothetical protein